MKIAICNVQEFNPQIGGIERVSVSLAEQLIKLGLEVIFISSRKSPYSKEYDLPATQFTLPNQEDYSEANREAFCEIIQKERCDILLNQNAHSFAYNRLCHEVVTRTKIKLVSVLHFCPDMRIRANRNIVDRRFFALKENLVNMARTACTYWPLRPFTMHSQRQLYRQIYAISDRVVLLSELFFDSFSKIGGLSDRGKLVAINNMLSFKEELKTYSKKKQILFCGRMTSQKQPYRSLYAWEKLQTQLADWEFHLVGDGPWLERIQQLGNKLNLERVYFHGFQDPRPFYQDASILWMTSNFEGWPLVLIEAMQYGCVPVAFKSFDSIVDIIDNDQNGSLVSPFDIDEFAHKTLTLIQSGELPHLAQAAQASIQQFSPDRIGKQWFKLFQDML